MLRLTCYEIILLVNIVMCLDNQNSTQNLNNETHSLEEDSRRHEAANNGLGVMEGYVVGGDYAKIDNYPHSVFLAAYCMPTDENYWICGSSIINQRILMTAAHCVHGCLKNFRIEAIAGTSNIENADVLRQIRRYLIHENYNPSTDYCDIALTMLNGDLPLGNRIRRVIIRPSFPSGVKGQVAGWGVVTDNKKDEPYLKEVSQIIRPASACNHLKLRAGMMCASSAYPKEYPAVGDSGSALITKGYQQIGLVSFKSKTRALNMIVYTNVSYFYDWIIYQSGRVYCG